MSLAKRLGADPFHGIARLDLGGGVFAEFKVRRLTLEANAALGVASQGIAERVAVYRAQGKRTEEGAVEEAPLPALEGLDVAAIAHDTECVLRRLGASVFASREVDNGVASPWVKTRVVVDEPSHMDGDVDVLNFFDMDPALPVVIKAALRRLEGGGGPVHPTASMTS